MSCTDREKQLPAYLGGGFSSAEMDELMDHLASCATCRKTLEDLKKTGRLVCDLEKISPPLRLKSQIMNRAREGAEKKGFLRKFFFPLYIKIPVQVLAVAVLSVFSFYLYRQDVPRMRTEEIPLPPCRCSRQTEPPLPGSFRENGPPCRKRRRADQEMPATSASRSDAGDSSLPWLLKKVPRREKSRDERTAESITSAAPLPPVMPQVSGRRRRRVFIGREPEKWGMSASTPFPTEKTGSASRCGTVPMGRGRKGERSPAKRLGCRRGNIPGMGSVGSRCEDGVGGIGGLCRKIDSLHAERLSTMENTCSPSTSDPSCRSFPGKLHTSVK